MFYIARITFDPLSNISAEQNLPRERGSVAPSTQAQQRVDALPRATVLIPRRSNSRQSIDFPLVLVKSHLAVEDSQMRSKNIKLGFPRWEWMVEAPSAPVHRVYAARGGMMHHNTYRACFLFSIFFPVELVELEVRLEA